LMTKEVMEDIQQITKPYGGSWEYEWVEVFPSVVNNSNCCDILSKTIEEIDAKKIDMPHPFSWSEDFSYYLHKYPGALFGLGAGTTHPGLHHPLYDFPDELIPIGIEVFKGIISVIQQHQCD